MYMTAGRWNRRDKIPTGSGFEDNGNDGVAGCMTWHYAVPSPPPPKRYHAGYRGYRPNETYGEDGTVVTTTTKTTVQSTRRTESPHRTLVTPQGNISEKKELLETKDLSVYRTEDVLPTQEYVTTTRQYYPPDVDLQDNRENIYNLQKYKNGYATDVYDNKSSSRIPYKSNLKKESSEKYGYKNGYSNNLVVHGNTLRDDSGYHSNTFRDDSGYHSNRFNSIDARHISGVDLDNHGIRDVSYKHRNDGLIHEDTLIDVIEDLQLQGEEADTRPGVLRSRFEKTQRTVRDREYPRRDLNNFEIEPEDIHGYGVSENDIKDLWRKHRDFKNHKYGQRQAGSYKGMSNREKAAMSAHHYRMQQVNREPSQAWGPPPPRPPSGRRQPSARFARAQKIDPAEKEIRFNSRTDFHTYTPEDAYMDRYEDVKSKIDEWRAQNSTSRVYDSGSTYRRLQRALRDPETNYNWRPPSPGLRREQYEHPPRAKDITLYKPKKLRYQVAAPYAEEAAPRGYSVFTPGPEDVKVRVQCPPSPRAKVTVNVDMDPLLD